MKASNSQKIALKMVTCRDQQVQLSGIQGFITKVKQWRPLFDEVIKKKGCSVLEALFDLIDGVPSNKKSPWLTQALFAVACEIMEPKYLTRAKG